MGEEYKSPAATYSPEYVFYPEQYIAHEQEQACPGAGYYRINGHTLQKKTTYLYFIDIWESMPTHTHNGETVQFIYAAGYGWIANGQMVGTNEEDVNNILAWCECFLELDPTEAIKKL